MIGIDIINIDRIAKLISQSHFVASKIFCEQEWQYYMYSGSRVETLAGMFCAKESFVKAMGCGFGDISMTDVCVC
ncbi:MAG: 4'-phosphopantetheinyl transferase superfamily protein, partial [Firmicutes bacterium]|nr:4'-phosphopantetheinyl transferase superfamily protein [Bacillota bacterium]